MKETTPGPSNGSECLNTIGFIDGVALADNQLKLLIKPFNNNKIIIDKEEYIAFISNSSEEPICKLKKLSEQFTLPKSFDNLCSSLLIYWMDKKIKLKFTIKVMKKEPPENTTNQDIFEITAIEPYNEGEK